MSPLVFLCLSLLVVGLSAEHHGDHMKDPKDALRLASRLDDITHRIQEIEKKVDFRLNDDVRIKARSLNARLTQLEEDHCDEHHFDCGGQDNECVSRLMVCDGHRDCRNGADEKTCDDPIKAGDVFYGYKVYDHCGTVDPEGDQITVQIRDVKHYPAYTTAYGVRAQIKASFTDGKETSSYGWPTRGYYSHSKRALILVPPPGQSRGMKCTFDGSNFNRCRGETTAVASKEVCAEYVYFRKGHVPAYLDDDEEEDHESDHHYDRVHYDH